MCEGGRGGEGGGREGGKCCHIPVYRTDSTLPTDKPLWVDLGTEEGGREGGREREREYALCSAYPSRFSRYSTLDIVIA